MRSRSPDFFFPVYFAIGTKPLKLRPELIATIFVAMIMGCASLRPWPDYYASTRTELLKKMGRPNASFVNRHGYRVDIYLVAHGAEMPFTTVRGGYTYVSAPDGKIVDMTSTYSEETFHRVVGYARCVRKYRGQLDAIERHCEPLQANGLGVRGMY